jgi:Asp-tRNA(Asn)/Glu-tRNA(Gln) amidotransferase A subunit family amidase
MDTAVDTSAAVRSGERSALEVLEECVGRIEEDASALGAFVYTDFDSARVRAGEIDALVARPASPVPFRGWSA